MTPILAMATSENPGVVLAAGSTFSLSLKSFRLNFILPAIVETKHQINLENKVGAFAEAWI